MKMLNTKGMTLIELILAMAIFSILAVSFLTMFSSSLLWIYGAGNKAEAYNIAQQDVERRIITGDAFDADKLKIEFESEEFEIRGGIIESSQSVQGNNSSLETFLPFIPTITVNPMVILEGETNSILSITGKYTHFNNNTRIEILDVSGKNIPEIGVITPLEIIDFDESDNLQELRFSLPVDVDADNSIDLLNNRYVIRVTTTGIEEIGTEVSRAKFYVEQPGFIVTGENTFHISSDGINWVDRKELKGSIPEYNIYGIASNGESYVVVGDNGKVSYTINYVGWAATSIGSSEKLNDVTWSEEFNNFYAVGELGGIYSSNTGKTWQKVGNSSKALKEIVSTLYLDGSSVLTAVGEGTIISSTDGYNWVSQLEDERYIFNSISSGNELIVASGYSKTVNESNPEEFTKSGILYIKERYSGWYPISSNELNNIEINSIDFSTTSGRFIAVGSGKNIIFYDGSTLSRIILSDVTSHIFTAVYTKDTNVLIVSDDGLVIHSIDSGYSFPNRNQIEGITTVNSVGGK